MEAVLAAGGRVLFDPVGSRDYDKCAEDESGFDAFDAWRKGAKRAQPTNTKTTLYGRGSGILRLHHSLRPSSPYPSTPISLVAAVLALEKEAGRNRVSRLREVEGCVARLAPS